MKTSKLFVQLSYIYLFLPILIFVVGWCNIPTVVLGSIILLVSLFFACKNAPGLWVAQNKEQVRLLVLLAFICLVWVYLSGIGALVFQNSDHNCRNPIFEILVQYPWPVMPSDIPAILTYYIGFWMPSAAVGKLFHSIQIGYYAQIVWAALGIYLFFYLMLAVCKRKTYLPVFVFILFSGLDVLGCYLTGNKQLIAYPFIHLEWWYPYFQFSSFTTQLFWVFNQAVPAWLAVMLMYHEKNNKNLCFLYACTFLHSTLPAIGLFPFVVYWYFKNGTSCLYVTNALRHIKTVILQSFTFQNTIGALFVILVSFTYLRGNVSGAQHGAGEVLPAINIVHWLVCFFLPEAGLYLLLIWKNNRRNVLYYITAGCLLIYPFITVGSGPDFCMRATIPALVILCLLVVRSLENTPFRLNRPVLYYGLILVLGLGSFTPIHEISRTVYLTRLGYTKVKPDLSFNNFFGWTENNLFLKYFGKNIQK